MNWPMANRPAGSGKGSRGKKIPTNPREVVVGDGSVLPPAHARSKSYRDVAVASGSSQGRTLPQVNLPGQARPGSGPNEPIKVDVPDIELEVPRPLDEGDNAWIPRINGVSKVVTAYLRHGGQDKKYNVHSSDGYVRVAVFIQLPEMKRLKIDQRVLELILMSASPRIMTNDSGDRIRAIQGHSLERFHIDELYEKINSLEEYVHHSRWEGGDVPDQLVLELAYENHLDQWRRVGTFVPSIVRRFHTRRAVRGTVKQEFGAKNIVSSTRF